MQLNNHTYQSVYFLGIGGIGMSAIARFFRAKGFLVAGYDHTATTLTHELTKEGIAVNYDDSHEAIPESFRNPRHTLVVRTPAVPTTLPLLQYFQAHGFAIQKRAEVLGTITQSMKALCVAGTHGKTTTSTMLAHLLHQSEIGCNAFLGGISNNYKSNLLLSTESNLVVVEADEYDRSFHHLTPFISIITSIDADHLDIYGTPEAYQQSFEHYTSLIRKGGALVVKKGLAFTPQLQEGVRLFTYSATEEADFYATNIKIANGEITFDLQTPSQTIYDIRLGVPVYINIENSVAAMAVAWLNGVQPHELRLAMASYAGIYRRFNIHHKAITCEDNSVLTRTIIDDYAHHPMELKASISSVKQLYPDTPLVGIFQPHLFTRTRDFADEFAQVLSTLDEVILLPIYPAREMPIEGINSEMLLQKITCPHKSVMNKQEALLRIKQHDEAVVLLLGAGDINELLNNL